MPTSLATKQERQQAQDIDKVIDALERATDVLGHLAANARTSDMRALADGWETAADELLTEILDYRDEGR